MGSAPNRPVIIGLFALGVSLTAAAHLASRAAPGRARKTYRALVGEKPDLPDDHWKDIRTLVGLWGCLAAVLHFLRAVGLVVAAAAALCLISGG